MRRNGHRLGEFQYVGLGPVRLSIPLGDETLQSVDSVDRAIIEALKENARISNAELAKKVGLTPGPCLRRVQKLESEGVILGYAAQINPESVGRSFEVGVSIELQHLDQHTVPEFERTVGDFDEVLELYRLFGTPDYHARVAVEDLTSYERFLTTKLLMIPGVSVTHSAFPMKTVKSPRARVRTDPPAR